MDQTLINHIKNAKATYGDWLARDPNPGAVAATNLLVDLEKALLGERPFDDSLVNGLKLTSLHQVRSFMGDVLTGWRTNGIGQLWSLNDPTIKTLVHARNIQRQSTLSDSIFEPIGRFVADQIAIRKGDDFLQLIEFLKQQQFTDEDIVTFAVAFGIPFGGSREQSVNTGGKTSEKSLSKFEEYLLPLLRPTRSFLGLVKNEGVKETVDKVIFGPYGVHKAHFWLQFLYEHYPEGLEGKHYDFLLNKRYSGRRPTVDLTCLMIVLQRDGARFQDLILKAMKEGEISLVDKFFVILKLNEKTHGKFEAELAAVGESHFNSYNQTNQKGSYYYEQRSQIGSKTLSEAYADFLFAKEASTAKQRIEKLFKESAFLNFGFFNYVDQKFGRQSVPLMMEALAKDPANLPTYDSNSYYQQLFSILEKYNPKEHLDALVDFALNRAGKKPRELACRVIARIGEDAIPKAAELVAGKTVDYRVTGALILASIESENATNILNDAVDKENNDDTRDIMLDALMDSRFTKPFSQQQVFEMIVKAEKRKKLDKWNEKWIEEDKLPKLFWKDGESALTQNDIRFLFYRMKRAQGLNSDVEARQVIHLLDNEKTAAFAKVLLNAFQDSNADIKLKYYLTLAGLLGDDEMMHSLNALVKKSIADKRMKMAEYVVGALAMMGSNKALRLVEVIYRKFANKKPAISKAAQDALTAAATELGITMDELSDRIIPNFDFEGLYKKLTVEGEEYRAFINSEFKLNYFTEDNKVRKSLPANAPKELKTEFKEIEKEINDVVKSQSGRLEKFMVEERRWTTADWRTFFFENPIMFVYALKLIWGVYDQQGNLVNSFYCSEDASLYNLQDDEVILEDGSWVGIVHPIHLNEQSKNAWKDKLYASGMITMFPILDRTIIRVDDAEKDESFSKKFFGEAVPKGADFVNTFLVKQQWLKSTGDGGMSEFTKSFKNGAIKAHANIEGPAAYYQGGNTPAKVYEINFLGKKWDDKILLKDLPPIFYSEVMSDIDQLVKAK